MAAPPSRARATDPSSRIGSLTRLFGFAQFEFAGTLAVVDGRYVLRDGENEDSRERVLVIETIGAPPPSRRRRRRPRNADADELPAELPVARATVVRAFEPFGEESAAVEWLATASAAEETVDRLVAEGLADLNAALHTQAVASGDPHPQALAPGRAITVRIGYGSGENLADGIFTAAHQVDPATVPPHAAEPATKSCVPNNASPQCSEAENNSMLASHYSYGAAPISARAATARPPYSYEWASRLF